MEYLLRRASTVSDELNQAFNAAMIASSYVVKLVRLRPWRNFLLSETGNMTHDGWPSAGRLSLCALDSFQDDALVGDRAFFDVVGRQRCTVLIPYVVQARLIVAYQLLLCCLDG